MREGLLREWIGWHQSPPAVLYHYTTTEGVLGIVSDKTLHAMDAGFLNDPLKLYLPAQKAAAGTDVGRRTGLERPRHVVGRVLVCARRLLNRVGAVGLRRVSRPSTIIGVPPQSLSVRRPG